MTELIPYEVLLSDQPFWVVGSTTQREAYLAEHDEMIPRDLGIVALGLFRAKTYVDYAAIGRVDDVQEQIGWSRAYEAYEWVDWMAGLVYRQPERAKQLRTTERKLGQFMVQYGWAPDVILETEPSEQEMQGYIDHIMIKDEVDGQLTIPEDD